MSDEKDKPAVVVNSGLSDFGCFMVVIVVLILMFGGGFIQQIQTPATCPPVATSSK